MSSRFQKSAASTIATSGWLRDLRFGKSQCPQHSRGELEGGEALLEQVELVESIRGHRNTTCWSGHKCGKNDGPRRGSLVLGLVRTRARADDSVLCGEVAAVGRCSRRPPPPAQLRHGLAVLAAVHRPHRALRRRSSTHHLFDARNPSGTWSAWRILLMTSRGPPPVSVHSAL
jgi:hypothetical protein